jgi:hypothetical protein
MGHVAHIGDVRNAYKIWSENLNSSPIVGSCEHGNEAYGSIKNGEFTD